MIGAITRWAKRRQYRSAVETNLWWLLVAMPSQALVRVLSSYPGIKTAADQAFARGDKVDEVSIRIAAPLVADIVAKGLPARKRVLVLDTLRARVDNEAAESGDPLVDQWLKIILTMENQAYLMVQTGRIDPELRDILMSEVIGALQGYTSEERSRNRIMRTLGKGLFPDRS